MVTLIKNTIIYLGIGLLAIRFGVHQLNISDNEKKDYHIYFMDHI